MGNNMAIVISGNGIDMGDKVAKIKAIIQVRGTL